MALRDEMKKQRGGVSAPVMTGAPRRKVDLQVDTIPERTFAAAYMSLSKNTITQNYVAGEDNSYRQSAAVLAHEQKHRDNNMAGLNNMPMSLEQYYKVRCHDEISATICELLQLRQEYIEAKTPAEREKIIEGNPQFSYYFDAVKKGEFNPLAKNAEDFDKEMIYIAVVTQMMWMRRYAEDYDEAHSAQTRSYLNACRADGVLPATNDANYAKALKIAYNIGGIDFSQYLDDIECINPEIIESSRSLNSVNDGLTTLSLFVGGKETPEVLGRRQPVRQVDNTYTGAPRYPKWSPDKRVSDVQYAEICDFTKPFLRQHRDELCQNEQRMRNNVSETKMNQHLRGTEAATLDGNSAKQKQVTFVNPFNRKRKITIDYNSR